MNQVINIVVDIETLSLQSDAAILSIAAVPFDPHGEIPQGNEPVEFGVLDPYLRNTNGELCPVSEAGSFYEVINATSCAIHGMHFDMSTVNWWSKQDEEAKAALLSRAAMTIGEAMNALHNYLEGMKNAFDADIKIWAQGSDFDFPILKNAYRKVMKEAKLPWEHYQQRDARTHILEILEKVYGVEEKPYSRIPEEPLADKFIKHSAWHDARRTAWNIAYVNWLLEHHIIQRCQNTSAPATSDTTPK